MSKRLKVGVIGARGHVGRQLVRLLDNHPRVEIEFMSSRAFEGQPLSEWLPDSNSDKQFELITPQSLEDRPLDVCYLAMPNGFATPYVTAIEKSNPDCIIIDISGDYRFDDDWAYGLPELYRENILGSRRISNPGCYATAMQIAIAPYLDLLDGAPACFGISGYSGAGTKPSPKNDPERLKGNIIPYALANHLHEEEVSRALQHRVHFSPHVAEFFRGISMTVDVRLSRTMDYGEAMRRLDEKYANEPLVSIVKPVPEIRQVVGTHMVSVGGVTLAEGARRLVVVSALDNLLKGAATQALQNLNLACDLPELEGIPHG